MEQRPHLPLEILGGAVIIAEFEAHDSTPLLFVCRATDGELYLCVCVDETPGGLRWLCAPVPDAMCLRLARGEVTFRECFLSDGASLCLEIDTAAQETRPLLSRDIPPDWLPEAGERPGP